MEEAMHLEGNNKRTPGPGFLLLNVAELSEKLMVYVPDILLVETDEDGSRNKAAYIKGEPIKYTLMNISLPKLRSHTDKLIRVNRFTLVSPEAVHSYRYDCITLKNIFPKWNDKQIVLARDYRESFYERIGRIMK